MNDIHVWLCVARPATQAVFPTHLTELLIAVLSLLDNLLLQVMVLVACTLVENKLFPATHGGSGPDEGLVDICSDWDALLIGEILLGKLEAHIGASVA